MVTPRRRPVEPEVENKPTLSSLERHRRKLVIDKDRLDDCLIEQPEVYYHVAEAHSLAIAERDAVKLDIEVAEAEEGQKIRDEAAQREEKLTEGGLKEQLLLTPRIQKLRRERLDLETQISAWTALKEAFQQRSYMLRELVPMHLSRFNSGSMTGNPRQQLADNVHDRTGEVRSQAGYRRRPNE